MLRFSFFSCISFARSSFGECTFDSLAFGITIPRFSVCSAMCMCVRLCAILNCHFLCDPPSYIALAARPIDTRQQIMCRWSFRFSRPQLCVHAVEMKSKPALVPLLLSDRCTAHNSSILSARTIYFQFFFVVRLLEQLPRIFRSSWVHHTAQWESRASLRTEALTISAIRCNAAFMACNTNDPEKTHVDKSWWFLCSCAPAPAVVWLQCATPNVHHGFQRKNNNK